MIVINKAIVYFLMSVDIVMKDAEKLICRNKLRQYITKQQVYKLWRSYFRSEIHSHVN